MTILLKPEWNTVLLYDYQKIQNVVFVQLKKFVNIISLNQKLDLKEKQKWNQRVMIFFVI